MISTLMPAVAYNGSLQLRETAISTPIHYIVTQLLSHVQDYIEALLLADPKRPCPAFDYMLSCRSL